MKRGVGKIGLWFRLARRFTRAAPLRRSAVIVAVVACAVMSLFVVLRGLSLSSEQVIERDYGRFSGIARLGDLAGLPGGQSGPASAAVTALGRAGVDESMLYLETYDLRPDSGRRPFTVFAEADWDSDPFPARYQLTDGRWPSIPGEVVATAQFAASIEGRHEVPILSGNYELKIVGRVEDRYATDVAKILAASGTWASFDEVVLAEKFPTLIATPSILWSGVDRSVVVASLAETFKTDATLGDLPSLETAIYESISTREDELAAVRRDWVDRAPIAYQVPSTGLVVLSVLAVFGLNQRLLRRNLNTLKSVGITAVDASTAIVLAGAAWILVAAVLGSAGGVIVGALGRFASKGQISRPLSEFPNLFAPGFRTLGLVIVTCLVYGVLTTRGQLRGRRSNRVAISAALRGAAAQSLRHVFAGVATGLTIFLGLTMNSLADTMRFVGIVGLVIVLLLPEIIGVALGTVSTQGPKRRLALQQLKLDTGRVRIAVALLAASLGPAVALIILLDTMVHSDEAELVSRVPPGQIDLASPEGLIGPAPDDLLSIVAGSIETTSPPIRLGYLMDAEREVRLEGQRLGAIMVVDTAEDAARLSNGALTPEHASLLRNGGIVSWDDSDSDTRRLDVFSQIDLSDNRTTEALPADSTAFQPSWERRADGLLLTSTAQRLDLPVSISEYVFTGVPDSAADEARQAAVAAGYDRSLVAVHRPPAAIVAPGVYIAAEVGLGLLMLFTVSAVVRVQVTSLRRYLNGLVAIGVPRRWVRDVVVLEIGLLMVLSATLGLFIAVVPILVAVVQLPQLALSVPWWTVAPIFLMFGLTGLIAALTSVVSLRAADREIFLSAA